MKTYSNREEAPFGLYVSLRPLHANFVSADGEPLEGREHATYRRVPGPLVLALSPLLGGLFVLFFPFILLAVLCEVAGAGVARGVARLAREQAHLGRVRWEPATSFLNKRQERAEEDAAAEGQEGEDELAELKAEAEERRAEEPAPEDRQS